MAKKFARVTPKRHPDKTCTACAGIVASFNPWFYQVGAVDELRRPSLLEHKRHDLISSGTAPYIIRTGIKIVAPHEHGRNTPGR